MTYPNSDVQTYGYDPMGNRTEKTHNSVPTAYSYDDADQMTLAGGVSYSYDDNGNQIEAGTDTFTWDAENRLIETDIAATIGAYEYNGDGLRISHTIGASAVSYVWDLNASLPVILQDTEGNRYVYGLDLLTRIDGTDEEWYLYDGLGSTTALADDTGTVTGTYEYDVFGAVRAHTGDATEWSYSGEQNDPTGLEYLRARYYDPSDGRFLSHDLAPPDGLNSQSIDPYTYVANNPTNWVDQSGLWCPRKPSDCTPDPVKDWVGDRVEDVGKRIDDAREWVNEGNLGYLDLNGSACIPVRRNVGPCATAGIQWQIGSAEIHPYLGAGVGSAGFGGALTWAPGQAVTEGWNCGLQATGGGLSYNYGRPLTYEGWGFIEGGVGVGTGVVLSCYYVF